MSMPTSRSNSHTSVYEDAPQEIIATESLTLNPDQIALALAEPTPPPAPRISDQTTSMIVTPQQVISLLANIRPHPTLEQRDILSEVENSGDKLRNRLINLNMHAIGSGSCFGPSQLGNIQHMTQQEAEEYFSDCGVAPEILQAIFPRFQKSPIEEELFTTALKKAYPQIDHQPDAATQQQFIQLVSSLDQWNEASEQGKIAIHQQLTSCIDSITDFAALAGCHNYRGTPLFLLAVAAENIPALNHLLQKYPAFIHALTQAGFNSLEMAIDRNSADSLKTLLDYLDDSDKSSQLLNDALRFAFQYNTPWAINLLTAQGARIIMEPKEKILLADSLNAARKEMKKVLSSLPKQGAYSAFDSEWIKARLPLCIASGLSKNALLALYDLSSKKSGLLHRNLTAEDRNRLVQMLNDDCFPRISHERVNTDLSDNVLNQQYGSQNSEV